MGAVDAGVAAAPPAVRLLEKMARGDFWLILRRHDEKSVSVAGLVALLLGIWVTGVLAYSNNNTLIQPRYKSSPHGADWDGNHLTIFSP